MTEKLRTLAEAEAQLRYGDVKGMALLPSEYVMVGQKVGFIEGFIAGRTSVTREQILEVVAPFMHDEFVQGQECPADEECADAVLALLNGENDD